MARVADGRTVVVGVDGSVGGTEALRYAVGAAQSRGMGLLVVHAYELPPHGSVVDDAYADAALASANQVPVDALSQVRIPAGLDVETAVELTSPLLLLERLSGDVALIVLGQHAADADDSVPTRTMGSAVAASSSCPMIIVPSGWSQLRASTRLVLACLDVETSARAVLRFAFREAERRGWAITALQTLPEAVFPARRAARIEVIIAVESQAHPGVPVTVARTVNTLGQVVDDRTRRARLVVVGRSGRPDAEAGDGSSAGAQHAWADLYCPLAVVPQKKGPTPVGLLDQW